MIISNTSLHYEMSKEIQPSITLDLPASVTFETVDAFGGQVQSEKDILKDLDFSKVNPATGPAYFNGLVPGDVLSVSIKDIRVASRGCMSCMPGAGLLKDLYTEESTRIVEIAEDSCTLMGIQIPLKPMIGVIGVAPEGEAVNCGTPGDHGGNMDTNLITIGSTLYFPVFAEGGLLAMGDLHAAMGNGEICVTGVEVSGEVDIVADKLEGFRFDCPVLRTPDSLVFIGSKSTLDEAVYYATEKMAQFLTENTKLSFNEATILMSAVGNAEISQVVDPLMTARFSMPIAVLRQLKKNWFFD